MSKPKHDKDIQIPEDILKSLLTSSEWRMLKNRFQIKNLLEREFPIRKIAKIVGVGTDTVVRIKKILKQNPKPQSIKKEIPWIFGKSDG